MNLQSKLTCTKGFQEFRAQHPKVLFDLVGAVVQAIWHNIEQLLILLGDHPNSSTIQGDIAITLPDKALLPLGFARVERACSAIISQQLNLCSLTS